MAKDKVNTHFANNDQTDFAERVRANQQKLTAELKPRYDFIVCGSGSSGSVVARRLAENADVSVLLLEAGAATMCRPSWMLVIGLPIWEASETGDLRRSQIQRFMGALFRCPWAKCWAADPAST